MTTFAEKAVVYTDGQVNVTPLPEAIMANGFIPETRDAPGMPLAAQHLNWLFRDLYRQVNTLKQNSVALPAWAPIPCPMETPPEGYLKCNGASFDKEKYPELAKGYPSGILPDLRGEFIRGWDDGRGIDQSRKILSNQSDCFREHNHSPYGYDSRLSDLNLVITIDSNDGPVFDGEMGFNDYAEYQIFKFKELTNEGEHETRPRNVAFLYIVRAA